MNARLTITSIQKYKQTRQEEIIQIQKDADVAVNGNITTIRYKDEGISKIIKIYEDEIHTFSFHRHRNLMEFKQAQHTRCNYHTDYGFFELEVFTNSVKIQRKKSLDICAEIVYNLTDGKFFDQEIKLAIDIKML